MLFGETFHLHKVTEEFASFNELHQEVDSVLVLEDKLHVNKEGVVDRIQDVLLKADVL